MEYSTVKLKGVVMAKSVQYVSIMERNPAMRLLCTYLIVPAVSALVIYLANMFFPQSVVLGTMSLSMPWAIALSAGKIALVTTFASAFFTEWEYRNGKLLSPSASIAGYLVVNLANLWFVSRFADIYGLGLSSWMVLVALAFTLNFVQAMVIKGWQAMWLKK